MLVCAAWYADCSVNWEAVGAVLSALVGAAAVYVAATANAMSKRQLTDAEKRDKQLNLAVATQVVAACSTIQKHLVFATGLLESALEHDQHFGKQKELFIRACEQALGSTDTLSGVGLQWVSGMDEEAARAVTIAVSSAQRLRTEMDWNLKVAERAAKIPKGIIEGAVRALKDATTVNDSVRTQVGEAFGLPVSKTEPPSPSASDE